jgi:hypothetical protein
MKVVNEGKKKIFQCGKGNDPTWKKHKKAKADAKKQAQDNARAEAKQNSKKDGN